MHITINGKSHSCPDKSSLIEALEHCDIALGNRVAIAVNKQVISRDQHKLYELSDGDEIMIVNPCYGG